MKKFNTLFLIGLLFLVGCKQKNEYGWLKNAIDVAAFQTNS